MSPYRKLVIEGPYHMVKGFVAGALEGAGHPPSGRFYAEEEGYHTESFLEQIQEWVGLKEHLVHLVLDGSSADRLVRALAAEHGLPLKLRLDRAVEGGHFDLHYEVFAPRYAKEIRALLESPPEGVVLEGFAPEVERHGDAKGVELYSPDHHWAERAEARASGPFPGIAEFYRACKAQELIRQDALVVDLEQISEDPDRG